MGSVWEPHGKMSQGTGPIYRGFRSARCCLTVERDVVAIQLIGKTLRSARSPGEVQGFESRLRRC